MPYHRELSAQASEGIHAILGRDDVVSIKVYAEDEHELKFVEMNFFRADGTGFVLNRRSRRFREVLEQLQDIGHELGDTFVVDLALPQVWTITSQVEVTATQQVRAYTAQQAQSSQAQATYDRDYAHWRTTSTKRQDCSVCGTRLTDRGVCANRNDRTHPGGVRA